MSEVVPASTDALTLPVTVPPNLPQALAPNTQAPPVPAQKSSHIESAKLSSEKVVVSAPTSFAGSAARIWRITGLHPHPAARIGLGAVALVGIACAWVFVAAWYFTFGLLLVPYRMIRRGQRKDKRQSLQHREMLAAINQQTDRR